MSRPVFAATPNAQSVRVVTSLSVHRHPVSISLKDKDVFQTVPKTITQTLQRANAICATINVCGVLDLHQMIASLVGT